MRPQLGPSAIAAECNEPLQDGQWWGYLFFPLPLWVKHTQIPMYLKVRHMAKHFLAFHSQLLGFYFWSLVTEVGFVFTSRCLPHFCSYFAWPTNGPRCLWANAFLSVTNYDSAEVLFLAASSTICHLEPQTGAAEKGWPEIVFHASCAICIDFVWQEEILQRFWRPRGAAYMCKGIVQPSKLAKYFGCSFPKGGVPPTEIMQAIWPKNSYVQFVTSWLGKKLSLYQVISLDLTAGKGPNRIDDVT